MVKTVMFFIVSLTLVTIINAAVNGDCPVSSKVTTCTPKCLADTDSACTAIGGKCCPNICNYKSCVIPKSGANTGGVGYKGTGSVGTFCGNVQCQSYEKCQADKSTSRPKCVRA